MYVELGMNTRHVVHGYGTVSFWMESGDVLQVENVLLVPGVCSQPHQLRRRDMHFGGGWTSVVHAHGI
jgi:hypothetical protein